MYKVSWKEFAAIRRSAIVWSLVILFFGGSCFTFPFTAASSWNREYNEVAAIYRLENSVQSVTEHPYARLVLDLERATTPEGRRMSYADYANHRNHRAVVRPDIPPITAPVFADPVMSLRERLQQLKLRFHANKSVDSATYTATADYLARRPRTIAARASPRTLAAIGLVTFTLIQLSMVIVFLIEGRKKTRGKTQWAVPTNLGSWLFIMLPYAPAFLLLWGGRLLWWSLTHLVFVPVAWLIAKADGLLFEADMAKFMDYATQRVRARRDEERRRLEVMARLGQDMVRYRLEVARAKERVEKIKDPTARQSCLKKIKTAEAKLDKIMLRREQAKKANVTHVRVTTAINVAPKNTEEVDDLLLRVEAFDEAERIV